MRAILLVIIIGVSLFFSIIKPFYGLLVFSWLAYMRPQSIAWANADWQRFSLYIAMALLIGMILNCHQEKFFVKTKESYILLALWIMLAVSTFFAKWPDLAWPKFVEFSKIFFIAIVTTGLINSRKRFKYICWLISVSLSFWGIKGAIWGILRGWHAIGPSGSMIADNNDFALALNMILPFFVYLGMNEDIIWRKLFFYLQFPFIIIAIIYTFSRGGFIGLCAVLLMIVLKSKRKFLGFTFLILGAILIFSFAPQEYKSRVETIKSYEEDQSAMARITAWKVSWAMAKDRPLTGVGLNNFLSVVSNYHSFKLYVAHNSYLQLLSEAGFIALGIFLFLLYSCIMLLRRLRKSIVKDDTNAWIFNSCHMLEIGILAYMVCGTFLSRIDFDLLYQFFGLTIALNSIVKQNTYIC